MIVYTLSHSPPSFLSDDADARLLSRSTDRREHQRELFTQLIARADQTFIDINAAPIDAEMGISFGGGSAHATPLWTQSDAALIELNRRAAAFSERVAGVVGSADADAAADAPPLPGAASGSGSASASGSGSAAGAGSAAAAAVAAAAVLTAAKEKLAEFETRAATRQFIVRFE